MSEPVVTSLDDLLTRYRYFLIDQFGVLHNGRTPYAGAAAALQKINESDAQAIIISNSGKRSAVNEQRMATLGFPRHSYHAMITSGETAWHRLHEMMQTGAIKTGTRCYLLSNDGDTSSIDGLGLYPTDQIDDADLIMLSGLRGTTEPLHKYVSLLEPAIAKGTLCICTNPDKWALIGNDRVFGPGRVAEEYQKLGGNVMWIGKPYAQIYQYCLSQFDGFSDDQKTQVCCIGDSIEHDICGGHSAGLNTLLVRTGIYQHLADNELHPLYHQHGATPDHLMRSFSIEQPGTDYTPSSA